MLQCYPRSKSHFSSRKSFLYELPINQPTKDSDQSCRAVITFLHRTSPQISQAQRKYLPITHTLNPDTSSTQSSSPPPPASPTPSPNPSAPRTQPSTSCTPRSSEHTPAKKQKSSATPLTERHLDGLGLATLASTNHGRLRVIPLLLPRCQIVRNVTVVPVFAPAVLVVGFCWATALEDDDGTCEGR